MEENVYPLIKVIKRVTSYKPIRNENGAMKYKDALQYLVRVIDQDEPSFPLILGLASFATQNKLSTKQAEKADEIIAYYEKKGVL